MKRWAAAANKRKQADKHWLPLGIVTAAAVLLMNLAIFPASKTLPPGLSTKKLRGCGLTAADLSRVRRAGQSRQEL